MSRSTSLERLPPHSTEAEAGVLGCILLEPLTGCEHCAAHNIIPDTFYENRHRILYESIVRLCMAGKMIDIITIQQHLKDRDELDKAGGLEYIAQLPDTTPSAANIGHYTQILTENHVRRKAIALCVETSARAFDKPPDSWLEDFRERVISLRVGTDLIPKRIGDLERPPKDDPKSFFQHRYVCEGGSLLINGPTGMGKSSFALQGLACWSNCLPFFGIKPTRPLTAILIQAENDEGDLAEMRDGICEGLKFTLEQRRNFFERVQVFTSNGTVGKRFCHEVIQPLLITVKPNILAIDPANSFLGGDSKEQKDVGAFLRTWLDPLIKAHRCMAEIIHHTNKPAVGKEKPNWRNGEWAYAGSGSAEWANWARAVLSIQDTGIHGIYRLHAGKRGVRLHWRNEGAAESVHQKLIGHATDGNIYWREAEESEIPDTGGRPKTYDDDELLDLLGDHGLTTGEWEKQSKELCGVKSRTFDRALADFQKNKSILKSKIDKKWKRIIPKN